MLDKSLKVNYPFEFSIIIAMYNVEDYLKEAIDSLINQTLDFKDNVQLILVDDGSTDSTKEIALEYENSYPDNVIVLAKENGGAASARNLGLEYATGEFISFFDSDDKISENTLLTISKLFKKYPNVDLAVIPIMFFERKEGNHPLNFRFKKQHQVVDLFKNPDYIHLSGASAFLRVSSINNHRFNEELVNGEDALFINEKLISKMEYILVGLNDKASYYYRKRFSKTSILDNSSLKKGFFTDKLKYFSKVLIDASIKEHGSFLEYMQNVVLYDLQFLIKKPEFPLDFTKEDIKEFWDYFSQIMDNIDEEVIINHKSLDKSVMNFLIYYKRKEFHAYVRPKRHEVFLKSNKFTINRLHQHRFYLDFIELKDGFLNFSGQYSSTCDLKYLSIVAEKRDTNGNFEVFESSLVEYLNQGRITHKKFLSIPWKFNYNFDLKVPVDNNEISSIVLKLIYEENNKKVVMAPFFKFREFCNISESINYFVKNSQIIIFKDNIFYTYPYSYFKLVKLNLQSNLSIIESKDFSLFYSLLYLILFPFMKNKNIWLFMDRQEMSDDNAEHLFKYATCQNDGVKKYFVLNKDSNDYKRMLEIDKNIVSFGSFKHKLLYLFANKIISSHPDDSILNPFFELESVYRGLSTLDKYFLQHGVAKDNMAKWLKKFDKNVSLIVTSSDLERESFFDKGYNYDEDIVQTLGLPRYDNLNNNTIKQIVIMPSWRQYLKTERDFLNSEYFLRWNNLINNEKLIEFAKNKGYKILFKPHPKLYEFVDLFDKNDYVSIDYDNKKKYQEIFNESALLITDYSSIFFDFSYLKKPIIYYQYGSDYHFDSENGYFNYDDMGFGDVIKDENILIDKIIEYLENDCKMEDKYKERVDKFFKYNDKNNCKRCYDWIYSN